MTGTSAFLVVGGDSLVGKGVIDALERRGRPAFATTRRRETTGGKRIYLDFESEEPFRVPTGVGHAFLIAAATNYERCESDPQANVINAKLIPRVVESLLEQNTSVTFISTNSVFGGDLAWPNEDDPHAPRIAYARQKSEGEAAVTAAAERIGASQRLNIVRLTKIMNATVPPIPAWLTAWGRGEPIQPFADLIFAPISVKFVGEALATIGETLVAGNLHLSGADNVSYVDFANMLAEQLGVSADLIRPTTATEKGVHIAFKPRFSGLAMTRTTHLTTIKPQTLNALVADLVADIKGWPEDFR